MLKIRNWSKWQSYRSDRGQPPWIKIHREVLRNPEWVSLTDAQRGQLLAMWILAADKNGELPENPVVIKKLCYMDSEPCLKTFIECGFIESDAKVTPKRRQHDVPETEKRQSRDRVEKRKNARLRAIPIPKDFQPSEANIAYAKKHSLDLDDILETFKTKTKAEGKTYVDWHAGLGTYLQNARKWRNEKKASQPQVREYKA